MNILNPKWKLARTIGSLLVGAAVVSAAPQKAIAQNFTPEGAKEIQTGQMYPATETVAVRLINTSDAPITYQAIGELENTEPQILAAGEEITLPSLEMPTSVLFYRKDGGLVAARAYDTFTPGVLTAVISDSEGLDRDDRFLRIQESGQIEIR
jgi:hypothetical protein